MSKWFSSSISSTFASLLIAVLPLLCALQLPASADAQAEPVQIVSEEREGVSGAWVPSTVLREVLADRQELDATRIQVRLLEERLTVKDQRLASLQVAADAQAEVARNMEGALEGAVRAHREAEEELKAWYRHPAVLIGAGVVATVLVEVGVLLLVGGL